MSNVFTISISLFLSLPNFMLTNIRKDFGSYISIVIKWNRPHFELKVCDGPIAISGVFYILYWGGFLKAYIHGCGFECGCGR